MKLYNDLFSIIKKVPAQQPDKNLLMYSSQLVIMSVKEDILLAQLKWCLDNGVAEDDICYKRLVNILSEQFGYFDVAVLIRQYKSLKHEVAAMNLYQEGQDE